jgi:hypothetical protein
MRVAKLFCVFLLIFTVVAPHAAFAKTSRVVVVKQLKGDVFIKKGGGKREFKAVDGMGLTEGDTVRTGKKSSVDLVQEDGTSTTLGEYTNVLVADLEFENGGNQTTLKVWSGKLWNSVRNLLNANAEFNIETPTAVMGVRGTLFFVMLDEDNGTSKLSVMDGAVKIDKNTDEGERNEKPDRIVYLNQEIEVDDTPEELPQQKKLNTKEIVEKVDPQLLAKAIQDVIDTAKQMNKEANEAKGSFEQTEEKEQLLQAVSLSKQATALSESVKEIIAETKASPKAEEVNEALQENTSNTLDDTEKEAEKTVEKTTKTEEEVKQKADEVGISEEEYTDIPPIEGMEQTETETEIDTEEEEDEVETTEETENREDEERDEPSSPKPSSPTIPQSSVTVTGDNAKVNINLSGLTNVYGIQVHLGLDLKNYTTNEGFTSTVLNDEKDFVNNININNRDGTEDELIFVHTLYNETSGYTFTSTESIVEIALPEEVDATAIEILSVMIVDSEGMVIYER